MPNDEFGVYLRTMTPDTGRVLEPTLLVINDLAYRAHVHRRSGPGYRGPGHTATGSSQAMSGSGSAW